MNKDIENRFDDLKSHQESLFIATINQKGNIPHCSYAPFVMDGKGNFFIFLSGLADHTIHLLEKPVASVMLIEDEQDCKQIYARCRATYQCEVEQVEKHMAEYEPVLDKMEDRFGNIVQLLRGLSDFILFRLTPVSGQFVAGFGKAFRLTGPGLQQLEPIDPSAEKNNQQ